MSTLNTLDLAQNCITDGIEWINGKYFYKGFEIKDIYNYLIVNRDRFGYGMNTVPKVVEVAEAIRFMENEKNARRSWYEPPLVVEARKSEPVDVELPFALDKKFFNVLAFLIDPDDEHMVLFYGKGGSGKSTYLNIIKQVFDDDYASQSFRDMAEGDFKKAEALSHRLICSDEMNCGDITSFDSIKSICTHDGQMINQKGQKPFTLKKCQSKMCYSTNTPPRFSITDTGMRRRLIVWEIMNPIPKEKRNPQFAKYQFSEDQIIYIIQKALAMGKDENPFIRDTLSCLYEKNPIYLFFKKNRSDPKYSNYRTFCYNSGYKACSEYTFDQSIEMIKEDIKILEKEKPILIPEEPDPMFPF